MPINFNQDIILENERVLLRPLVENDFEHLLPFSLTETDLWIYSLQPANGKDKLKKYMDAALNDRKAEKSYPFIVFDKQTNEYAGSTRFYDYQPTHKTVQLGFTWYGKKFQRTGLNRHCKFLLLDYAFDTICLHRVEFRADNKNVRSIEAMKKIGCTPEGILRSNCDSPNGRRDSIVLSILRDEWEERLKDELKAMISK